MSRHTSIPLPSSRRTSRIATSGWASGIRIEGLGGRGRLTDHLDLLVGFEELPYAFPDQLVVVEEEDPDTHGTILPVPGLAEPRCGLPGHPSPQ